MNNIFQLSYLLYFDQTKRWNKLDEYLGFWLPRLSPPTGLCMPLAWQTQCSSPCLNTGSCDANHRQYTSPPRCWLGINMWQQNDKYYLHRLSFIANKPMKHPWCIPFNSFSIEMSVRIISIAISISISIYHYMYTDIYIYVYIYIYIYIYIQTSVNDYGISWLKNLLFQFRLLIHFDIYSMVWYHHILVFLLVFLQKGSSVKVIP